MKKPAILLPLSPAADAPVARYRPASARRYSLVSVSPDARVAVLYRSDDLSRAVKALDRLPRHQSSHLYVVDHDDAAVVMVVYSRDLVAAL